MKIVSLGELMPQSIPSIDPARYPDEIFELWSIPSFDVGRPEILKGSSIGSSKKCVEPNDVLLSRIIPHIRRSWVVNSNEKNYRQIASGEWITFRNKRFYPPYLRQFLISDLFHNEFMQTVAGVGGSLLRARPEGVKAIKIPFPPLEDQKRIAAILDQADALRRLRQRAIDRLNTLGQAIFYEMFGDPSINTKKWPTRLFLELATNEDGRRVPIKMADRDAISGGYPYYGASGIIDQVDGFIFEGPHLLIGEDGANLITRSSPIAFMAYGKFWVNNHAHVLSDNGEADLRYLEFFIEMIDLKKYVSGSAQPKLTQAKLNSIIVPYPPLEFQHKFTLLIEQIEKLRGSLKKHLNTTQVLFNSLQHRAFRGEL